MLEPEQQLKLLIQDRPWEGEPDNAEWEDAFTGYRCRIRRHPTLLHLNGYVGIPKGHRLYGLGYDHDAVDVETHGGLTYSDTHADGLHWFGFDCGHAGDLVPGVLLSLVGMNRAEHFTAHYKNDTYRTWEYVGNEVRHLAQRLWRLEDEQAKAGD